MNEIEELVQEAEEILKNAFRSMMNEEITQDQYQEVKRNLLIDVGLQLEIITEG